MTRQWLATLIAAALVLAAAYGLKDFYSRADSGDLGWILRPTAGLVSALSGHAFEAETGAGWLNRESLVLIAPACAGVNFLIIAFCMSALYGVWRIPSPAGKAGWIIACAGAAWGLTVGVNAVRIILSMALYRADIYSAALTPGQLHRIGGAAVYYLFLYLYFVAISRILERKSIPIRKLPLNGLWPLACYLAFSLGVPLLNHAWQKAPHRFAEHAGMVAAVSVGICLSAFLAQWTCGWVKKRIGV